MSRYLRLDEETLSRLPPEVQADLIGLAREQRHAAGFVDSPRDSQGRVDLGIKVVKSAEEKREAVENRPKHARLVTFANQPNPRRLIMRKDVKAKARSPKVKTTNGALRCKGVKTPYAAGNKGRTPPYGVNMVKRGQGNPVGVAKSK